MRPAPRSSLRSADLPAQPRPRAREAAPRLATAPDKEGARLRTGPCGEGKPTPSAEPAKPGPTHHLRARRAPVMLRPVEVEGPALPAPPPPSAPFVLVVPPARGRRLRRPRLRSRRRAPAAPLAPRIAYAATGQARAARRLARLTAKVGGSPSLRSVSLARAGALTREAECAQAARPAPSGPVTHRPTPRDALRLRRVTKPGERFLQV